MNNIQLALKKDIAAKMQWGRLHTMSDIEDHTSFKYGSIHIQHLYVCSYPKEKNI
jgi:hypothetical protein